MAEFNRERQEQIEKLLGLFKSRQEDLAQKRGATSRTIEDFASKAGDANSQKVQELNKKLDDLGKQYDRLQDKLNKISQKYKQEIENSAIELKKRMDTDRFKSVETIGVFVALFTFVSSQINIFKNSKTNIEALALCLVFGGILIMFVLVLELVVKENETLKSSGVRFFLIALMSTIFTGLGIYLLVS